MNNPFETLSNRLSTLESLALQILERLESTSTNTNEVGGIELAQEVTRLSKARIYQLVSERAICHSKKGNRLTFKRADLLQWLAEGKRNTASA